MQRGSGTVSARGSSSRRTSESEDSRRSRESKEDRQRREGRDDAQLLGISAPLSAVSFSDKRESSVPKEPPSTSAASTAVISPVSTMFPSEGHSTGSTPFLQTTIPTSKSYDTWSNPEISTNATSLDARLMQACKHSLATLSYLLHELDTSVHGGNGLFVQRIQVQILHSFARKPHAASL